EQQTAYYPAATLEGNQSTSALSMLNWEKGFYTIDNTKIVAKSSIPSWTSSNDYPNHNGNPPYNSVASGSYPTNYTVTEGSTSANVYKLNAATNKTGLGFMIKVMAGDVVNIFGKSYYYAPSQSFTNGNSSSLTLSGIFASLLNTPGNAANAKGLTDAQLQTLNSGSYSVPSSFIRGGDGTTSVSPKAYINYIFFDEQFRYAGGDASRVGSSATVKSHWSDASLKNIAVPKSGFLYVYVSNESNVDVFFDNLQVVHNRGPILEETHYYPFGLTMEGISSKAAGRVLNRYKFNDGTELEYQEFSDGSGLELYATEFRSYDPQIGRFHQIDPLGEVTDNWSPYAFVQNSPILYNDPLGLDTLRGGVPEGYKPQNGDVLIPFKGSKGLVYNTESGTWIQDNVLEGVTVTASSKKKEEKKENPASKTPWMDKAESQLGVTEDKRPGESNPRIIEYHSTTGKFKDDAVPWCASFVNWCFVKSNIPSLNSARAFDYKNFGVKLSKPAYGAVAIMNYSHVGFVAGRNSDGRIVLLGGNQADAVNYSPNAVSAVLQYRYPAGFKPNYSLPTFKLKGRSLTGSTSR
ncbi:MAG: TIGR02594 family protein, partial [Pedobacter sp.]